MARQRRRRQPATAPRRSARCQSTQHAALAIRGATTGITVYADRARHLGSFDPFRREMHLGLGCAIENFVLAARAFGIATDVQVEKGRLELSPGLQPVVAARIALGPAKPSEPPLFDAIPRRRTHRGPYRDQPVDAERLQELAELVSGPKLRVVFVTEREARRELGGLIVEATERIIADPDMSLDSFRWIRTGKRDVLAQRDGVTIDTAGAGRLKTAAAKILPDLDAATVDRLWLDATRATQTATAPVFGMILVPDRLDMVQAITAGRAWQRLHLAATACGLAAQPLNQPVEMIDRDQMLGRRDEFGSGLATLSRDKRWQPTFVFRLGVAEREAPHSPRRALEDVVTLAPQPADGQ